jgi:phage gp45-like
MDPARAAQRLLHMLLPGRMTLIDDSGSVQRAQADFGPKGAGGSLRIFDKLPVLNIFGFTSNPPAKSDVLAVFFEGDPTKGVVVASNHQPSRLKNLAPGDSAMFDVRGAYVWLTPDGLVIDAGGQKVRVQNASKIECTGDVVADCDGTAISLRALHDAYNAHKHGGVQTGGGVTGATDHPA